MTPEQVRSLVEQRIREEILYREALALGLDRADPIVKRRLAQKMGFLAEDVSSLRKPTADELRAWFDKNSARYSAGASLGCLRRAGERMPYCPGARGEVPRARTLLTHTHHHWR